MNTREFLTGMGGATGFGAAGLLATTKEALPAIIKIILAAMYFTFGIVLWVLVMVEPIELKKEMKKCQP